VCTKSYVKCITTEFSWKSDGLLEIRKKMRGREELKSLIEINYVGLSLTREMFEGSSVSFV
jgi:hypothetical protein